MQPGGLAFQCFSTWPTRWLSQFKSHVKGGLFQGGIKGESTYQDVMVFLLCCRCSAVSASDGFQVVANESLPYPGCCPQIVPV